MRRLGDVPAAWHFTITVISMEGRGGGRSKGSAWGKSAAASETEKEQAQGDFHQ